MAEIEKLINFSYKMRTTKDNVDFVIYHGNCDDGSGSAYAVWKYMQEYPEREVTYFPAFYNQKAPDVSNKHVLICDFSYKKDILQKMISEASSLLVIDHHLSAQKDLADIPEIHKIFDMSRSGASLTWSYIFPDQEIPLLVKYIEDRDIWAKKLENTDAFSSWFSTLPHEFEIYDKYLNDQVLLEAIQNKGLSFIELNEYNTNQAVNFVAPKFMKIYDPKGGDRYYFVGYVNSNTLKSDIGNRIFTQYPYLDFSAVYSIIDRTNSTSFSLRSTDQHVNVSEVATLLGGGGHRNASAINLKMVTNVLPGLSLDNGALYDKIRDIYFNKTLDFNIVYFNFGVNKREIGKYLLQIKYDTVQECVAIAKQRNVEDKTEFEIPEKVDMAAVWSYDGLKDKSKYTIILHSSLEAQKEEIYSALGINEKGKITYDGLVKSLTIV